MGLGETPPGSWGLVRKLLPAEPFAAHLLGRRHSDVGDPHLQSVHPGPSALPELTAAREGQQLFPFYRRLTKASRVLTPSRRDGVFMVFIPEDGALRLRERDQLVQHHPAGSGNARI